MTDKTPAAETLVINAYVTQYESRDGEECDWLSVVSDRLRETYPGADVNVEYAPTRRVHAYGPGSDEIEAEFAALHEIWWEELCEDPDNPAWIAPHPRRHDTMTNETVTHRYRVNAHGGVWSRTDDLNEAIADARAHGTAKVYDERGETYVASFVLGGRQY